MEYVVSVAAQLTNQPLDGKILTASELYEGGLDWSDFDSDLEVNLGVGGDRKFNEIVQTTIPAPVSFRGTPAARFWELEDARIEYGLLPVGPTDLGQLLMNMRRLVIVWGLEDCLRMRLSNCSGSYRKR